MDKEKWIAFAKKIVEVFGERTLTVIDESPAFAAYARYVALAESRNGLISGPLTGSYIWGDALADLARVAPNGNACVVRKSQRCRKSGSAASRLRSCWRNSFRGSCGMSIPVTSLSWLRKGVDDGLLLRFHGAVRRMESCASGVCESRMPAYARSSRTISSAAPPGAGVMMLVMMAAAKAAGVSRLRGAAELRAKESDRIEDLALALKRVGISCQALKDGIHQLLDGRSGIEQLRAVEAGLPRRDVEKWFADAKFQPKIIAARPERASPMIAGLMTIPPWRITQPWAAMCTWLTG